MFTAKDLLEDRSKEYYDRLFERLFKRECAYLKPYEKVVFNFPNGDVYLWDEVDKLASDEEKAYLYTQFGVDEAYKLEYLFVEYNRAFIYLAPSFVMSLAIVRMLLDAITLLYAEYKHPFKVLYRVFNRGVSLNQIKLGGKQLNPSELRKELDDELGTNISELYKHYSHYVHPSRKNIEIASRSPISLVKRRTLSEPSSKEIKKLYKEALYDVVSINRIATRIIKFYMQWLKTNKPQLT